MSGTRICVCEVVQCRFPLLGVSGVDFASRDDKVYYCNCVEDVIVVVTGNNSRCTKAPVYEAINEPDSIFITEAPYSINVSMGEKFNTECFLYGLVGTFYFYID